MRWNTATNQKLCLVYMLNYLQMKTGITATIIYLWFSQQAMSNSLVTPWTIAHQSPLSVKFPGQGCWSGLPFPSPGDFPDPGIKPGSPTWQVMLYCLSYQGSDISHLNFLLMLSKFSAILISIVFYLVYFCHSKNTLKSFPFYKII